MKIGLVRHLMDEPGGGARQIALLARDLGSLGADVTLYCYAYDPRRCFPDILESVDVRSVRRLDSRVSATERGWRLARRQLKEYYVEAPRLAALIARDTQVLNPHEWPAHRSAALFARHHVIPVVWSYNDPNSWHISDTTGPAGFARRVFGRFDTRMVNQFAMITTLDERMKAIAERAFAIPVWIVRSGVDYRTIDDRPPQRRDRWEGARLRLLSVGVLFPHRRFEDVIRAVALARSGGCECEYEVIGSDRVWPSYAAELEALVRDLGLREHVRLRFESVSDADLLKAYRSADVLLFANEQQTWGLAPLEAMSQGLPAIVSRGAGVHEVLTDGETALLVDPRSPEQIAEALGRLARSPDLRARLGRAGHALVRSRFSSMHYAEQMLDVFRERLERPVAARRSEA